MSTAAFRCRNRADLSHLPGLFFLAVVLILVFVVAVLVEIVIIVFVDVVFWIVERVARHKKPRSSLRCNRTGLGRRLRLRRRRRIRRPEVAPAVVAHPELIWRPRHAGPGIAHFHLRAAALT